MRLFLAKFNERKAAQEGVHLEAVPLSQRVELIERTMSSNLRAIVNSYR